MTTSSLRMPRSAPALFATNALVAWAGVVLSALLSISGYYLGTEDLSKPTVIGNVPAGHDQWWERLLDWATFFTIWSNVTVAIVLTVLWRRPQLMARTDGVGTLWRALRLDSVLMIVITGIVYNLLLATGGTSGWDLVSETTLHTVVPLLTLVVWLVAGPRGLLNARVIGASVVLPLVWAAYALARGTVIGAYPYSFLDVAKNGWVAVLTFVLVIVVVGVVLALLLLAVDRFLPPRTTAQPATG
jgi:hypothetical protein